MIEVSPDSLEAEWTLTDMRLGTYILSWERLSGWTSPNSELEELTANSTLTFTCEYLPNHGMAQSFVTIPLETVTMPAVFTMGSTVEEDETPRQVTLTRRFLMAATEVTNAQYLAEAQWAYDNGHVTVLPDGIYDTFDGSTEKLYDLQGYAPQIRFEDGTFYTRDPDRPVVSVSWRGAVAYCDWLSMQESLPRAYDHSTWSCNDGDPYGASGYRLPTEAEWEFACRASTTTHFNTGDCLDSEAAYSGYYPYVGCPVGPQHSHTTDACTFPPNAWGLYDMHGNVAEYCNDQAGSYEGDVTDPVGGSSTNWRMIRGGFYYNHAENCRSATRDMCGTYVGNGTDGFRMVRTSP